MMTKLAALSDEELYFSYHKAISLGLDEEFILMLLEEMEIRGLKPEKQYILN